RRPDERLLTAILASVLPGEEEPDDEDPADHHPDGGRETAPRGPALLRDEPSPRAGLQDAEDEERETRRGQDHPDAIEMGAFLHRCVLELPRHQEDDCDDEDLGREDPTPREVGRTEAAD